MASDPLCWQLKDRVSASDAGNLNLVPFFGEREISGFFSALILLVSLLACEERVGVSLKRLALCGHEPKEMCWWWWWWWWVWWLCAGELGEGWELGDDVPLARECTRARTGRLN